MTKITLTNATVRPYGEGKKLVDAFGTFGNGTHPLPIKAFGPVVGKFEELLGDVSKITRETPLVLEANVDLDTEEYKGKERNFLKVFDVGPAGTALPQPTANGEVSFGRIEVRTKTGDTTEYIDGFGVFGDGKPQPIKVFDAEVVEQVKAALANHDGEVTRENPLKLTAEVNFAPEFDKEDKFKGRMVVLRSIEEPAPAPAP